jgi:Sec-independent protein translocase protein TatA
MFDTSFLQVVVFVVAGALLVGPKDLPVVWSSKKKDDKNEPFGVE